MNRNYPLMIALLTATLFAGVPVQGQHTSQKAAQKDASAEVIGKWIGGVSTHAGEMAIEMDLKKEGTKIVGRMPSMHGTFTVTDVTKADGQWTIAFKAENGATGKMLGSLKDGKLVGDWDFRPHVLGKFHLRRKPVNPKG